jgi:hypothetical protein
MRLQYTRPEGEPSVKMHAIFFPLLLLVIIPFALALSFPLLVPDDYPTKSSQFENIYDRIPWAATFSVVSISAYYFFFYYLERYESWGKISSNKAKEKIFLERKYSRIQINLYEVLNRILFAEIAVWIVIGIIFYATTGSQNATTGSQIWPFFEERFYPMEAALGNTILVILLCILISFLRRDFRFIMAQRCMDVANEEANKVEKINYLIAGLSWYNKYLKRNFDLEFDEKRVASNIISSSSDKNQIVKTIEKSFNEDSLDRLKPASCLSTFANLESKEQFLIDKKISTKIKEVGTFIAVIIPVLITVLQFAFPRNTPLPTG